MWTGWPASLPLTASTEWTTIFPLPARVSWTSLYTAKWVATATSGPMVMTGITPLWCATRTGRPASSSLSTAPKPTAPTCTQGGDWYMDNSDHLGYVITSSITITSCGECCDWLKDWFPTQWGVCIDCEILSHYLPHLHLSFKAVKS